MRTHSLGIISILIYWICLPATAQSSNMKTEQDSTIISNNCYTLGHYQICPSERKIKAFTRIGGVDWDGYTYVPYDEIDFDNTEMYLVGNAVLFKEQTKGRDLKKAHFISPKKYQMNDRGIPIIVFDNDSVFEKEHQSIHPLLSTEGKSYFADYLMEDKEGGYYVIMDNGRGISAKIPDSLGIDKATIRHLTDNFFYDKNKFYALEYYEVKEGRGVMYHFGKVLGKNEGNNFRVGADFCCINDQTFILREYAPSLVDMNVSSVREYPIDSYYSTYLITDGDKMYINSLNYQGADFAEIEELFGLDLYAVVPSILEWYYNPDNKMIYLYPDNKQRIQAKRVYGFLMYSQVNNKAFVVNRDGQFSTYNGIMMPAEEKGSPRKFDSVTDKDVLKSFEPLIVYGFSRIFHNGLLNAYKENGINNDKLVQVGKSIFYTDGKSLVWLSEAQHISQNFGNEEKYNNGLDHIQHLFKNWICPINNPKNLVVINDDLLADGNTLYYVDRESNERKLIAVPFTDLGIPVSILEKGRDKISDHK